MKKIIFTVSFLSLSLGMFAKDIKELVVTTNPPLSCQNCENKIKKNLRFEKGVTNIETSIPEQKVVITYDADKTNPEKIAEGFQKIGYDISDLSSSENQQPVQEACH